MDSKMRVIEPITTEADGYEAAGIVIDAILMHGDIDGSSEFGDIIAIEPVDIVRDKTGQIVMVGAVQTSIGTAEKQEKRILATS